MTPYLITELVKLHGFVSKKFPAESIELDARVIGYWAKRAGLRIPIVPKEPAAWEKTVLTYGKWIQALNAHRQMTEAAAGWQQANSETAQQTPPPPPPCHT